MKKVLLSFICLMIACAGFGQNIQVTGKVVSAKDGSPQPGVTVLQKGTSNGTTTGPGGTYSISVPGNATLDFSAIGSIPQDIPVKGKTSINVALQENSRELNALVVTAFGLQKEDKNLGYSVTKVNGEDITRTNTVNPIAGLQGKVAGVMVNVMSSAGVQTSPYIQIRGAKVLGGNNQPIFVVDGNVLQNNLVGADAADGGSQLKDLNPDNYESITVLKGAAATAIYGSRGINGAIVITTKTGKAGKGIGVEYSTTYSQTKVYAPFMQLQNEFGMGSYNREGAFYPDGTQDYTSSNWGPAFDGSMHPAVYNKSIMVPYVAQPDNWKTFFQDGHYANNNLTLSGGSDKYNYRFSYSNTNDAGILPNNGLKRNALDVKLGGQINKVFSFETGIDYANTATTNYYNQSRYYWPTGQNIGFNVYYMPRNTNFAAWHATYRNPDNSTKPDNGFSYVIGGFNYLDKNHYTNNENSFLGYSQLKAQVNPWLDFSARGNINYLKNFAETKNYGTGQFNSGGQYSVGGNYSSSYDVLLMGHAVKKAMNNDLSIDLRLLNEYYGNMLGESYSASTKGGLKVPNEFFLGNSVNDIATNKGYGYGINYPNQLTVGVGGDLNLNYKGYLNLELTGRNDWLSTLTYPVSVPGKNNYSVFYPSANLSYSFYDHFQNSLPSWLSSGRIRASIAEVGNAGVAGVYSTGAGYSPGVIVDQNGHNIPSATQINGNVKPNYDLKPQISRSIELGTNLGFFNNLVNVDFTWYKTNTINQLLQIPGVMETGYNTLYINAGNIQNKGIELLVDVNPIRTKDWNLDLSVNLAHNAGKIIQFYPGITTYNHNQYEGAGVFSYQGGAFGILAVQGGSAFQLDPKTGYPLIETTPRSTHTNPSTKVDFANYQYVYDTVSWRKIGKVEPDLMGGFLVNLRYKNFSLFTQVDARFGGYVSSESYTYAMGQGTPLSSLQFRDKAHGGVARTDSYTGQTVYDGAVPNAVFAAGQVSPVDKKTDISGMTFKQAYAKGLVESWYAPAYYDGGFGYNGTYDWENGLNYNGAITKESWVMLREITLSYQLPSAWLQRTHVFQGARLSLSARNIGYLYNSLPDHQNPESVQSNDPLYPYITGGVPFSRNYTASLDIRF